MLYLMISFSFLCFFVFLQVDINRIIKFPIRFILLLIGQLFELFLMKNRLTERLPLTLILICEIKSNLMLKLMYILWTKDGLPVCAVKSRSGLGWHKSDKKFKKARPRPRKARPRNPENLEDLGFWKNRTALSLASWLEFFETFSVFLFQEKNQFQAGAVCVGFVNYKKIREKACMADGNIPENGIGDRSVY